MRPNLLQLLVCPTCRAYGVELIVTARDAREVREGHIFCRCCRARYTVSRGIVDLLGEPPEAIRREQDGWLKLLGETTPDLDTHMLLLPYLPDLHWQSHASNFDGLIQHVRLQGGRVLDVGSGRAWSARLLMRHNVSQVVAIDVLRQKYIGLETAELYFAADGIYFERVLCDMATLPFASQSFNAVFSTASLHHALDLQQAFMALNHVLTMGGLALIVNEPVQPYGTVSDLENSTEVAAGINEHTYTIAEWLAAAHAAGFSVHLYMPQSIIRAYEEGRFDQVAKSYSGRNYLPSLLGSAIGRRLLQIQPVLLRVYRDYGLPLVMIARKCRSLANGPRRAASSICLY
jgi:ubiquinone/menaquinone biosynthesis C-methylase UbiE/uncharacterized protein YbaR (Trm112 family)